MRGVLQPFIAAERLSMVEAVRAFTEGSAYVNDLDRTGRIEVGNWADLIVVDRDIFRPSDEPIGSAKVLMTLVGGQVVYEDHDVDW